MSHKHVLLIMIEPLDTIQKEYKRISYEKRSGHGEIFYEYQHPYKCLDRFISLFFFSELCFSQSQQRFAESLYCFCCPEVVGFALGIDLSFLVPAEVFNQVFSAVWFWKFIFICPMSLSTGLSPLLGAISFLKISLTKPIASFTSMHTPQTYSYKLGICRCGGFLQSFAHVPVVPG